MKRMIAGLQCPPIIKWRVLHRCQQRSIQPIGDAVRVLRRDHRKANPLQFFRQQGCQSKHGVGVWRQQPRLDLVAANKCGINRRLGNALTQSPILRFRGKDEIDALLLICYRRVFVCQQPGAAINEQGLVKCVMLGGHCALDKPLPARFRTVSRWQQARCRANLGTHDPFRHRKLKLRLPQQHPSHELMPDWASAADAAHLHHWGIVRIAYPNPNHEVGSVANRPVITKIGGGSRLGCRRAANVQRARRAKRRNTCLVVAQDVGDQEGDTGVKDRLPLGWWFPGVKQVARLIAYFKNIHRINAIPAIRQCGISSRQIQQTHLTPAQRQ